MEISRRARVTAALMLVPIVGAAAAGCGADSHDWSALAADPGDAAVSAEPAAASSDGKPVDPARPLTVKAAKGTTISDVTAVDSHGRVLPGVLDETGASWRSTNGLAAGERYTVKVAAITSDGHPATRTLHFRTGAPENVLRLTTEPENGAEVGVGQPVVVHLSKPVRTAQGRRAVQQGLTVDAKPAAAKGSWYWVDSKELHYRPQSYWPAHATVVLHERLGGQKIETGVYGAPDKDVTIRTGDAIIATADGGSHTMTVRRNGKVVRTIPITMGKPGFSTREGVKVVLGKQSYVRMKSSTVGIAAGSSESYDLPVHWATRMTWSGEYVHAAPWSVGSQGVTNASHGCIGMSTGNAEWFFSQVEPGDVVKVVNSGGHEMEPFGNGFGDWNVGWKAWQKGSAADGGGSAAAAVDRAAAERRAAMQPVTELRPQT